MIAVTDTSLEYASLREQGLTLLRRVTGQWTDHNTHDPGITILELVCYALAEFGYRADFGIADLLADADAPRRADVFTPAEILPSGAVTLDDLRKVVLDVPGVKNVWIEPVEPRVAVHDASTGDVSYAARTDGAAAQSPNVSDVRPAGLYRVRIEKSDVTDIDGGVIVRDAARRLHRHRGLGEDFVSIDVLEAQPVQVDAVVEVAAGADAADLLAGVYRSLAEYCSPSVRFRTLEEMLAAGRRVDDIFEGPLLEHGFIDPDELAAVVRRDTLRVSDLIRELTGLPGVVAVKQLRFRVNGVVSPDWLLSVDPERAPRFDPDGSTIRLERRNLRVDSEALRGSARALYLSRARAALQPPALPASARDLPPPPGRPRHVGAYRSIQHDLPMVYGVGPAGLSRHASPRRRAQARQLQAYLLLIDQLLANQFAQLANVRTMLSLQDDSASSYFAQPVPDDGDAPLGLDAVRLRPATHAEVLARITENPADDGDSAGSLSGASRRTRLLDHLLARVGEHFDDYALVQFGLDEGSPADAVARVARDKRAFLRDCPRIGRDRGTGVNYLEPAAIGSSAFVTGDCVDPVRLAARWAGASDAVSAFLWSRCTPEEQEVLRSTAATRHELDGTLCAVLNRALDDSLWDEARFDGIPLSAETRGLRHAASTGVTLEPQRFNRVLIEDAYPDLVARSRDAENVSGLELALRRRLGIDDPRERFHVVEHILLRPVDGDARQQGALFRDAASRDPYSLQVTIACPAWPPRCQEPNFRQLVEETARECTPAHLAVTVRWLDEPAMTAFERAFGDWLHHWRNQRRAALGL